MTDVNNLSLYRNSIQSHLDMEADENDTPDFSAINFTIKHLRNYGDASDEALIDQLNGILNRAEGQSPNYDDKENLSTLSVPVAPE